MGLFGKTLGGLVSNFKNKMSQGIQSAIHGLTKTKDFVYNNRNAIGGALNAAAPFIGSINPALGLAATQSGTFLQKLQPGPVKDTLSKIAESDIKLGGNPVVQQLVEHKRLLSKAFSSPLQKRKRNDLGCKRKKSKSKKCK